MNWKAVVVSAVAGAVGGAVAGAIGGFIMLHFFGSVLVLRWVLSEPRLRAPSAARLAKLSNSGNDMSQIRQSIAVGAITGVVVGVVGGFLLPILGLSNFAIPFLGGAVVGAVGPWLSTDQGTRQPQI